MALVAAGLFGTSALLILLTPDPRDPLRCTAAVVPALIAGFALLRARPPRAGRSLLRPPRGPVWLAAAGAWGALAVGARHLPLRPPESLVAAAGVLLLAGWLAAELPGLLRRLARGGGGSPPCVFFLLPLLVYVAVLPWILARHTPGGDEPYYLLAAHSLAYGGDLDLADNYAYHDALAFMPHPLEPRARDSAGGRGAIYFADPPAGALLLALPYRVAGRAGAALCMLVLAAGVAWGGLALARELHPRRPRGQLLAWLALAFGSPLALYSYRAGVEVPAALALTAATLLILRSRHRRRLAPGRLLALALLLACPPLLAPRYALVSASLAALAWWWTGRRWRAPVAVAGVVLAATAAVTRFELIRFERVFGHDALRSLDPTRHLPGDWLLGLGGLMLDDAVGLAAAYPLWLLLLPGLALTLVRRPAGRGVLLAWLPYFLMLLPRHDPFASFAPPFRHGVAVLPLLAACLIPALVDRRTSLRTLRVALACLTLASAVAWTVQPAWIDEFPPHFLE